MKKTTMFSLLLMAIITGCHRPITQYTINRNAEFKSSLKFKMQLGGYTSISIFRESYNCYGIEIIEWMKTNIDKEIFVKNQKYITIQIGTTHEAGIGYGSKIVQSGGVFSIPFEEGDIEIIGKRTENAVIYDFIKIKNNNRTKINNLVLERKSVVPFFDNQGPWCTPDDRFKTPPQPQP